jgi:hypothetical protein
LPPTLYTLQVYAKFLGKVRRALTPRQKHWYHAGLRVGVNGLTTSLILAEPTILEMVLDLIAHRLVISTSRGEQWQRPLDGQSAAEVCEEGLAVLASLGVEPEIDRGLFSDTMRRVYDREVAGRYFQALSRVNAILGRFQGELREETSPLQLWPHHMDLAMLWFSGRLVPGIDPADEEHADEQMNFGFAPGDDAIPSPYFYITAYPMPDGLVGSALPADATWHTESFTGAVMPYESLVTGDDPAEKLLDFLRTVQQAAASLMR